MQMNNAESRNLFPWWKPFTELKLIVQIIHAIINDNIHNCDQNAYLNQYYHLK